MSARRPSAFSSSTRKHASLYFRFALAGAVGVGVNLLVLYALVSIGHLDYLVGEVLAAGVASGSNYILNVTFHVIGGGKASNYAPHAEHGEA